MDADKRVLSKYINEHGGHTEKVTRYIAAVNRNKRLFGLFNRLVLWPHELEGVVVLREKDPDRVREKLQALVDHWNEDPVRIGNLSRWTHGGNRASVWVLTKSRVVNRRMMGWEIHFYNIDAIGGEVVLVRHD